MSIDPSPDLSGVDRLVVAFGADAIRPLLDALAAELAAAAVSLDGGDRIDAHRLGGLAGTLGLSAVARVLGSLDRGEASAVDARRAIRAAHGALATYDWAAV